MKHNEDSRVKIPSILHLCRLGYNYLPLKSVTFDSSTNIATGIFSDSILRINKGLDQRDVDTLLSDISIELDNDDLGRAFYERLIEQSGTRLIDFENFNKNSFHVVTELTYKKDDEEFRPDITLLINGMPLVFIEVKKPNNKEGVLAERNRINTRCQNPFFKKFINITQLMLFSNNMEYDDHSSEPIEGAFYATTSYDKPSFNYFREEIGFNLQQTLKPENDEVESLVLEDNNLTVIKHSPEFQTNKSPDSPTNRICTSLLSRERLSFILQYALTYVKESQGLEKHVMRYPQIFATKAIEEKLEKGIRKGIIWHTQGSGKTALSYYNVRYLTDYFQTKNIIPKFYFIVDRIDLLNQAKREFVARDLVVHTINSRDEFARDIRSTQVIHNLSGKREITVVNIQKFKDDPDVVSSQDYNIQVQRIYFLDEVHRSYNPKGSFLANLSQSDTNAIKIGLTGTPLLGDDINSKKLFGDYIHKYYYNASIADGYTLRLIREEIATNYKMLLEKALAEIELLQGTLDKKKVFAHEKFVEPMLDYIIEDFEKSRVAHNDNSIGGMVICDSSEQAKEMFKIFGEKYASNPSTEDAEILLAAEPEQATYNTKKKLKKTVKSASLILHDVGTKQERKDQVDDFKAGKIDFLFVYNMLLTGFDAKRLKKLYLGRVIKKHNLLQALTRVNRTYKGFRYGYVVDFADIKAEFDATNKAYFDELQSELGDEMEHYSDLFKSKEEIEEEIEAIKSILFKFDTENAEIFSQQISQIQDKKQVQEVAKALGDARSLYNMIRLFGHFDLLEKLDFQKINHLYREANNHLQLLNLKENVENSADTTNLLNVALEDMLFMFTKVKEEELILADNLKNTLRKTREALAGNFDQKDPKFLTLKEELERLFKKKKLDEVSQAEMKANIGSLEEIYDKVLELNRENNLLLEKYKNDPKYARIHKRLIELGEPTKQQQKIFDALVAIKEQADKRVMQNSQILQNQTYFENEMMPLVIEKFMKEQKIKLTAPISKEINKLVVHEYMNEFNGFAA